MGDAAKLGLNRPVPVMRLYESEDAMPGLD